MKNVRLIISSLLTTSLLCACSNNLEEVFVKKEKETVSFTANDFEYEASARTAFNITNNGAEFTWAENDTIGVFPDEGDQVSFSMEKGAGSNTATFDGGAWNLKNAHTYYAYYPFNRKNFGSQQSKKAIPVSYEGQKQVGNNNPDNISLYDYMTAIGTTPESGTLNFQFKHLGALLQINATMPKAMSIKSVSINLDSDMFVTEGSYDLTARTPVIKSTSKSNFFKLNVEDLTLLDNDLNLVAYMMIPPCNLSDKTATIVIEAENGEKYQAEFTGKNYETGKAYQMNVTNLSLNNDGIVNGTVTLKEAGTLATILGEDLYSITRLKIAGPLNGTDIKCLRQMLATSDFSENMRGVLTELDLQKATIVEGGDYYYDDWLNGKCYTSNNAIGDYMFYSAKLKNIILPNNVTTIGDNAFYHCSSLTSVTIGNSVTTIGIYAFINCGLTSVIIPNSVTTIGDHAFQWCDALTCVTIPNSVTTIGWGAFYHCSSLTSVTIGNGVTTIGSAAFEDCSSLISVTIPNSVTTIGSYAFYNCIYNHRTTKTNQKYPSVNL